MNSSKDEPDEILDDLESIRDILEKDEATGGFTNDEDIPVLQDVVDGGLEIDESPLGEYPTIEISTDDVLDAATLDALLGDNWKEYAEDILADARSKIEDSMDQWSPQDTNDFTEALKVRIDDTINEWLAEVLAEKISALRERLKIALREEATEKIREHLGDRDG